jgi:hypothetical protein
MAATEALNIDDLAAGIARRDRVEHGLSNTAANLSAFAIDLQLLVPAPLPTP